MMQILKYQSVCGSNPSSPRERDTKLPSFHNTYVVDQPRTRAESFRGNSITVSKRGSKNGLEKILRVRTGATNSKLSNQKSFSHTLLTHSTIKNEDSLVQAARKQQNFMIKHRHQQSQAIYSRYEESKEIIDSGVLMSRNLTRHLKPKRGYKQILSLDKYLTNINHEMGVIHDLQNKQALRLNDKLKVANYALNVKQNVHQKYDNLVSLLTTLKEGNQFVQHVHVQFMRQKKMKKELDAYVSSHPCF